MSCKLKKKNHPNWFRNNENRMKCALFTFLIAPEVTQFSMTTAPDKRGCHEGLS